MVTNWIIWKAKESLNVSIIYNFCRVPGEKLYNIFETFTYMKNCEKKIFFSEKDDVFSSRVTFCQPPGWTTKACSAHVQEVILVKKGRVERRLEKIRC
jgi:hypothetical protein